MFEEINVNVGGVVSSVEVLPAKPEQQASGPQLEEMQQYHQQLQGLEAELAGKQQEIANLLRIADTMAGKLKQIYESNVSQYRQEMAELAVEIARRILNNKVEEGDYQIENIISDALETAPENTDVEVHINPQDLQQLAGAGNKFEGLEMVSDVSIKRGDCLIKTPQGVVKSLMEEKLKKITETLKRAV